MQQVAQSKKLERWTDVSCPNCHQTTRIYAQIEPFKLELDTCDKCKSPFTHEVVQVVLHVRVCKLVEPTKER